MDKAKAVVSDFISKAGHHDTTVHERVLPVVKHETLAEQRKDERTVAIDREIHQDHYHTTVQPVKDREILPEQHHHNIIPVEHKTHDNRDHDQIKLRLQQEAAQFKDQSVRAPAQHETTTMPTVQGEHVHHHVHETIQPVVQREVIEPHVVHTTIPVHEVHHKQAQHHSASALPAVTMAEFKKSGGTLTGREERVDHFDGEPKNIERALGGSSHHGIGTGAGAGAGAGVLGATGAAAHHRRRGSSSSSSSDEEKRRRRGVGSRLGAGAGTAAAGSATHHQKTGPSSSMLGGSTSTSTTHNTLDPRVDHSGHQHTGVGSGVSSGSTGNHGISGHSPTTSSGLGQTSSNTSTGTRKPSLLDRLNPMKDSDGDGKAGFMK